MTEALVFDVGGTRTRAAIYDGSTGRLLADDRRATPTCFTDPGAQPPALLQQLLDQMVDQAESICGPRVPDCIGIAFAGPVFDGAVLRAPTIWGDRLRGSVPLHDLAAARWPGRRVYICNDMTAAGYRYLRTRSEDFCIVTVSSGIGHKTFVAGQPAVGPHGRGGEIGHFRIDDAADAPICDCGGRGHLAAVSCGRATAYQTRRLIETGRLTLETVAPFVHLGDVDNRRLAGAFRTGIPAAVQVIESMAIPLGRALGMLHLATGFERACIIGGFALALGPAYLEMLCRAAAGSGWDTGLDWNAVLELGDPDDDAVLIGLGRALAWGQMGP